MSTRVHACEENYYALFLAIVKGMSCLQACKKMGVVIDSEETTRLIVENKLTGRRKRNGKLMRGFLPYILWKICGMKANETGKYLGCKDTTIYFNRQYLTMKGEQECQ